MKTDDVSLCSEEFQKILTEMQELRNMQSNMDARYSQMKQWVLICFLGPGSKVLSLITSKLGNSTLILYGNFSVMSFKLKHNTKSKYLILELLLMS